MNGYEIPESLNNDINELNKIIEAYKTGELSSKELRARRVPFGVYEQRKDNTFMVRIRCPGGYITPDQFLKVSELSEKYGADTIHITTRQEIQIHYINIEDLIIILNELKAAGLSTRGGGGNTVRNITVPDDAGIDVEEIFDVTPYAVNLTTRLIAENDSWSLPRKYKIAFSGTSKDKAYAAVNDLGFIAKIKNGNKGFKVFIAGGMGAKPEIGKVFFDFIDHNEVYNIAEGVKNFFNKYGNRKNKHSARLRFLWNKLGEKDFLIKFNEEYNIIKNKKIKSLEINEIINQDQSKNIKKEIALDENNFNIWKKRFTKEQKQKNLFSILMPVECGLIGNEKAKKLSVFLKDFGDNVLRFTKEQNILLRNINESYLSNVYNFLKNNFNDFNRPVLIDKIISCTGADTCKLGICLSQKLLKYSLIPGLIKSNLDLDKFDDLVINISGCPNACGQHHIADIGFYGKASRKDENLYPAYNVSVGAKRGEVNTSFNNIIGEISAYKLTEFLIDVLKEYTSEYKNYNNFYEYINDKGLNKIKDILLKYKDIPSFNEDKNYYFDFESKDVFSLASRGMGECSAGLFDLIEVDIENINKTKDKLKTTDKKTEKAVLLKSLIYYSSRMLLVTRGIEPKTEYEVYDNFIKYFIDEGLIKHDYKAVILHGKNLALNDIIDSELTIFALSEEVINLYQNMDDSLQFNTRNINADNKPEVKNIIIKDFRSVACPMNFVKTKMELSKLKKDDLLEIYLDDGEPINNVPGSVKSEGHQIIEIKKINNYWSVLIKKG